MKLIITFLICLLTNLTQSKNVIKCSKTELGKDNSECENYLGKVKSDSKNADINAEKDEGVKVLEVVVREKRSPIKGKKKEKGEKKEIGKKKGKNYEKAGKTKKGKEIKGKKKEKGEKKEIGKKKGKMVCHKFVKNEKNKKKDKKKANKNQQKEGNLKGKKNLKKGKNEKKKSVKRTKRAILPPRAEILDEDHIRYVEHAHTFEYGPFNVKLDGAKAFIRNRFKNHYDAILSQESKVTKNDYLEKINKVLQGLDIKDVSNKKEVYLFISFYIDGSVEFHGYGGASREPPSEVNIKEDMDGAPTNVNAHTFRYGPFDVKEFIGKSGKKQMNNAGNYIKRRFKIHYRDTAGLSTSLRGTLIHYLEEINKIMKDIDRSERHLTDNDEVYFLISFYIDGNVVYLGYCIP